VGIGREKRSISVGEEADFRGTFARLYSTGNKAIFHQVHNVIIMNQVRTYMT
jgi:hypothetical protein